jgi:hypothetical protein
MLNYTRLHTKAKKAVLGILLLLGVSAQAGAEVPQPDIFIGTMIVEKGEVILNRCDAANNRYVLRDDTLTKSDAVARYTAQHTTTSLPIYAEVYGRYFETQGRSGLDVLDIDNLTPGRDCHLLSAIDLMFSQAAQRADISTLWLGPTQFRAADIISLSMDFDANGMPVLDIALSPIAGERLSVMTGQQIGRTLDMRLDDQLIDQVVIVEAITQGKLRLSGRFAVADIKRLMRDMACKLQLSKDIALGLSAKERKCPKGNVGNSGKPTAE